MADYSISAEITADSSKFNKGVNNAEKSLKSFSKGLADNINKLGKNGLVGAMANVSLAVGGLTKSFGTVIKFAKDVGKAINECTEAYKTQVIAERALDTAIQNNPFMSGSSSQALKQFASDMQRVSNYGDEQLIPMMTNLVSLGRTESETMKIMSVAMDMSAGMGISLDTAITQLNATLNGNIGRLGQQNAELKDLTEEELRQGKAVEILGEKFKGLSNATADTSKQLQNIKGDFKEALGQFTLPSSDMWNKFWAGFYEKGIAVIQKFNDYLDVKIIGKQLVENIYSNARTVAKANKLKVEDVLGDFRYVREELSYLNDSELATLQKTLERQKQRTRGEEVVLSTVKQLLKNKELEADEERAIAEAEAKKAREIEAQKTKEKELAELRKKQAEEREKALQLEGQWQDKLLSQQISILEKEKESAVEGAEERGEATYEIERYYNEKILALKLQQIEKEREEALKGENVTADAKIAINQYYDNEVKKIYDDLGKYKKAKKKEEVKEEKKSFDQMLEVAKQYAEKIAGIFSKISGTVKNVISKIVSGFKSLFEFNVDDALDEILKFEDSILTFFVETLPRLPQFFKSVMQSITVLVSSIFNALDFENIGDVVYSIIESLGKVLNTVARKINSNASAIISGVANVVRSIIQGLSDWIETGGWKEILNLIFVIQQVLENAVADNLEDFAKMIGKMIPDLVDFLIKSIVSASRTLGKIAKTLLPLIAKVINAIVDVITSDEVVKSSIEAVEGIVEGLIPAIVDILVNALPKIISFFLIKLPMYTPQLIIGVIDGLIKGFANVNWGETIKEIFKGLWESTIDFFTNLGETIGKTFTSAFENIKGSFGGGSSGGGSSGGGVNPWAVGLGVLTGGLSLPFFHANGTNNAQRGLAVVGEAGPELVRFNGGEQVLNTRNTQKALAGMGGNSNTFNVNFTNVKDTSAYALVSQLKQYNRQLSINGIL